MYCENCGILLPDPTNQHFCQNCGIPLKYQNMIDSLKKNFEIIAGAVIKDGRIIYTTDNWDISEDVDRLLSSWSSQNAQFITISGVKYSILQMEAERLAAISLKGEGSILATKDDDHIIILQRNNYSVKTVEKRIKSIMETGSINELTIEREYLPEIFGADVLEISKHDGLPILKSFVIYYLLSKGLSTNIFGNIIKLEKVKPPVDFLKFVTPEPKLYQVSKQKGEIKHNSRDIKLIDSKLKAEIQSFLALKDKAQKILKIPKAPRILENEYKINEYITLKLEDERTYIYVNGKRFLQCIRLFLQIPPQTRHLYEEIGSIDEAAEVYKQSLWENRIVEGPMARPSRFQNTTITPEQEFWGHCSNLQAWVEHKYDTRVLMSNAAFPLLKKLAEAGDPLARKVFKEEIAQRLESGYPSVVQYLIVQGYISHFTPFEFKNIIDTTNLIKTVSSQPKILSEFLQSCAKWFPTILGDIVLKTTNLIKNISSQSKILSEFLQSCAKWVPNILGDIVLIILDLPEGKENLYTASSRESWELPFRVPLDSNPKFLDKIKDALMVKLRKVRNDKKGDILDYIQVIDDNVYEKKREREAINFEVERAELKKINEEVKIISKKEKKRLKVIRKKEEKAKKKLQKIRSYLIRDFQDEEIKKGFKKQFGREQTVEDINHFVDGQMQYAMLEIIDKYKLGSDSDREIKEKKESEILLEIAKNDLEYKILLKRKKAGESVEDLIKQNNCYAEILKKDKDNIEEAKKWYLPNIEEAKKWYLTL